MQKLRWVAGLQFERLKSVTRGALSCLLISYQNPASFILLKFIGIQRNVVLDLSKYDLYKKQIFIRIPDDKILYLESHISTICFSTQIVIWWLVASFAWC